MEKELYTHSYLIPGHDGSEQIYITVNSAGVVVEHIDWGSDDSDRQGFWNTKEYTHKEFHDKYQGYGDEKPVLRFLEENKLV